MDNDLKITANHVEQGEPHHIAYITYCYKLEFKSVGVCIMTQ